MNKVVILCLIGAGLFVSEYGYNGSTTAAVVIAGSVIKTSHVDKEKKYPRKECPVCKGTGKYLSGDGIKMVDCGYCEADSKQQVLNNQNNTQQPECKTKVQRR